MKINVTRTSLPPFEEYCEEIRKLWDSRILTNMGAEHKAFQAQLEAFLECPHITLFTNGHLALEAALAAMRLPAGGEVITTPFTFPSTTHAIVRSGLVPVFCDIREDDATLDASLIEPLITERTAAILPVHVYGHVCDVERIGAIAARHRLKVIYDAAHAFGVRYKGQSAVRYGDAAILSFHATKVFSTIEGGAVCYADGSLAERLDDEKNFGIRGPERCAAVGGNAKMSEFQAAMGICNLRHFDRELARRRTAAERYRDLLDGLPGLRLLLPRKGVTPNYAHLPVVFDGGRRIRDRVYEELARHGIGTRKYFYPLTSACECYAGSPFAAAARTPVAARLADSVLALPLYADLELGGLERICSLIRP